MSDRVKLNWFPLNQFIHFIYFSLVRLAILDSEERRKMFNSTAFIKLKCVHILLFWTKCMHCPLAFQAEHSGNYTRFFVYFSPKKGCPMFCMRPWIRKDYTIIEYFNNPKLKQGFQKNMVFLFFLFHHTLSTSWRGCGLKFSQNFFMCITDLDGEVKTVDGEAE